MSAEPGGAPDPAATAPDAETPWSRLHRLTVAIYGIYGVGVALGALIPTAFGMIRESNSAWVWLALLGALVVAGFVTVAGEIVWRLTRYRVTDERVEQRTGIVFRNFKSIPRDRVRAADITANPIYQILGLAKVNVGTGQKESSENLVLDAVTKDEAERLRVVLLRRAERTAPAGAATETEGDTGEPEEGRSRLLAALDWSWIRYAPLTTATFFLGLVPVGVAYQAFNAFGVEPVEEVIDRRLWQLAESALLSVAVTAMISVLVMGIIGICLLFIEAWWNYRLEREPDGTLRVRRGLLTNRSLSLEERRLRGIDLGQPLLVRFVNAARVRAVATGLMTAPGNPNAERSTLLPVAPRGEAERVAAAVLREEQSPTAQVRLLPHPKAALRRRMIWLLTPTVIGIIALAILGGLIPWLPGWIWVPGLLGLPVAAAFAYDAYRNLGHGRTDRYLITRHGSVNRHTIALRRDGVIGVTARQTIFQRRAGVMTFGATTAAGDGVYLIRDADESAGLAFVEQTFPELLAPFVERDEV